MKKELAEFRAHVLAYREHFREPTAGEVRLAAASAGIKPMHYIQGATGSLCLAFSGKDRVVAFRKLNNFALGLKRKGWQVDFLAHRTSPRCVFTFKKGPLDIFASFDSPRVVQISITHASSLGDSILAEIGVEDALKRSGGFREGETRRTADREKILRASRVQDKMVSSAREKAQYIREVVASLHSALGVRRLNEIAVKR